MTQIQAGPGKVTGRQTDLVFKPGKRDTGGKQNTSFLSAYLLSPPPKGCLIVPLMKLKWKSGPQGGA